MDSQGARTVLIRYRPGTPDGSDPDVIAALGLARQDAELALWLDQELRMHATVRAGLRALTPPPGLRERLLAPPSVLKPVPWWNQRTLWAAAALLMVLATLTVFWRATAKPSPDRFEAYRARMVSTVLREYRMDLKTPDLASIQNFLSTNNAPANYTLPPALTKTTATGAGLINWREKPVAMLCFDRGDKEMLFLFVIARRQVRNAPPNARREFAQVNKLMTANWSEGNYTYVLAGAAEQALLERYSR